MSVRRYFIPGGYFASEVGRRAYFVPGFGFHYENGANTFNETLHEDLTLEDRFVFTYDETLHEDLTADFAYADTVRYRHAFIPGGYFASEYKPGNGYFIPGIGFVTKSNRNTPLAGVNVAFTDTLHEDLTADFQLSNWQGFAENHRIIMHAPDLQKRIGGDGGFIGCFGGGSYGSNPYAGSGTGDDGDRIDNMVFNIRMRFAMLAPDLPDATSTVQPGCYGGPAYGTAPYAGSGMSINKPGLIVTFVTVLAGRSIRYMKGSLTRVKNLIGRL